MTQRKPNLFIVGAMKSGTSSLHDYLSEHPDIFMSTPKEPSHFSRKNSYKNGHDEYLKLFEHAGKHPIIGESSTQYAKAPLIQGVPDRIYEFNPNARILYLMRDPVERAISHYWFNWMNHGETRDMLTAFKQDKNYIDFSHYSLQLSLYSHYFDWSQIKAITTEDLATKPIEIMKDLFQWLNVDSFFTPNSFGARSNVTPKVVFRAKQRYSVIQNARNSIFYKFCKKVFPERILFELRNAVEERRNRADWQSDKSAKAYIKPIFRKQISELEVLLDRKFPHWDKY